MAATVRQDRAVRSDRPAAAGSPRRWRFDRLRLFGAGVEERPLRRLLQAGDEVLVRPHRHLDGQHLSEAITTIDGTRDLHLVVVDPAVLSRKTRRMLYDQAGRVAALAAAGWTLVAPVGPAQRFVGMLTDAGAPGDAVQVLPGVDPVDLELVTACRQAGIDLPKRLVSDEAAARFEGRQRARLAAASAWTVAQALVRRARGDWTKLTDGPAAGTAVLFAPGRIAVWGGGRAVSWQDTAVAPVRVDRDVSGLTLPDGTRLATSPADATRLAALAQRFDVAVVVDS